MLVQHFGFLDFTVEIRLVLQIKAQQKYSQFYSKTNIRTVNFPLPRVVVFLHIQTKKAKQPLRWIQAARCLWALSCTLSSMAYPYRPGICGQQVLSLKFCCCCCSFLWFTLGTWRYFWWICDSCSQLYSEIRWIITGKWETFDTIAWTRLSVHFINSFLAVQM